MRALIFCILAVCCTHAAQAAPPKPIVELSTAITLDAGPVPLAKIDGRWVAAPTAVAAAVIHVETEARWVQCRVAKIVTVDISGVQVDVVTAAAVDVLDVVSLTGKSFGIVAPAGKYQCTITATDGRTGITQEVRQITLGDPVPPTPVVPIVPPKPVSTAPFPASGFAVLIIQEASGILPGPKQAILNSLDVRKYIDERAVELSDGSLFRRVWDDDISTYDLSDIPAELKKAYELTLEEMDSLPWIAIVGKDGVSGYGGPLPENVTRTMELLKEYGE